MLIYFIRRRRDMPFPSLFWLFGLFIVSCGFTHFMEVLTAFSPVYRLSGLVKIVTALASWGTVVALIPAMPVALSMRSPSELQREVDARTRELREANEKLRMEIEQHRKSKMERAQLADIVESSQLAIIGKTLDGIVTSWNQGAEVLFGYSAEEIVGKSIRTIVPAGREEEVDGYLSRIRSGEAVRYCETVRMHKDGRQVYVSLCLSPIRDDSGTVVGSASIAQDITGRQEAEDSFRRVFNAAPFSMVHCTGEGLVKLANPQAERDFGYAAEELIGRPIEDLIPERFRGAHPAHRDRYMSSPVARPMGVGRELYALRKDKREFPVEIALAPIQTSGGMEVMTFIVDITNRRKAEDDLKQLNQELEQRVGDRTKELEEANRELEAFCYSVSHDLRAPLRHIDGYIQVIKEDAKASLAPEIREHFDVVADSARRMGVLIDELLVFSRMGRQEMRSEWVDMKALACESIGQLASETAQRAIQWNVEDLPGTQGDKSMLRLVWDNLLDNALKYSRTKPKSVIGVTGVRQNGECVYAVRDNGVGFDMKYLPKLFGVFQRLHNPSDFEGTGIGLANVRRIVERHGGRVWAEARKNDGAAFYFSLPFHEEAVHELPA